MIRGIAIFDAYGRRIWPEEGFLSFAAYDINLDILSKMVLEIREHLPKRFEHIEIGRYRASFLLNPEYIIVTLNDRVNEIPEIETYMTEFEKAFLEMTGEEIQKIQNPDDGRKLQKIAEDLLKYVPVKICYVGGGGVGKTTIVKLLAEGRIITRYVPTIFADVRELEGRLGPFHITLFTVAGQPQYRKSWDVVSKATDIVMIVLDSTPANLRETKEVILPLIFEMLPYSRYVAIANKQDLPGALPPRVIEEELGLPTYGLVAIREDSRDRMIDILTRVITRTP